jgi:hypothetical protein
MGLAELEQRARHLSLKVKKMLYQVNIPLQQS